MDLLTISSVVGLSFALGGTRAILELVCSCMAQATTANRR
jgi:hypothetical protein